MRFLIFQRHWLVTVMMLSASIILASCVNEKTPLPAIVELEPQTTDVLPTSTVVASHEKMLEDAIQNVENASSFQITSHDIRAYKAISPDQKTQLVFGEFINECNVFLLPSIKVKCSQTYRFSPDSEFFSSTIYYWQDSNHFYQKEISQNLTSQVQTIDIEQAEPFSNDIYKTIVNYGSTAKFIRQQGNMAEYRLEHPEWYRLNGALGFTNLGILLTQQNSDQLIKEYLVDHFQNVKPPVFTFFIDVTSKLITRVKIDDKEFMNSVWAAIDQELIEKNGNNLALTKYEVLEENASTYNFLNYNEVIDFKIP